MLLNHDQDIAVLIAELSDLERSHRVDPCSPVARDLGDESFSVVAAMLMGFAAVNMHDSDVGTLEKPACRTWRERCLSASTPGHTVRVCPGLLMSDLRNAETRPLGKLRHRCVAGISMRSLGHDSEYPSVDFHRPMELDAGARVEPIVEGPVAMPSATELVAPNNRSPVPTSSKSRWMVF